MLTKLFLTSLVLAVQARQDSAERPETESFDIGDVTNIEIPLQRVSR